MKLSESKKILIKEAKDWCDNNDKSTEFMLQYMQDYANATHDEVMTYIEQNWKKVKK